MANKQSDNQSAQSKKTNEISTPKSVIKPEILLSMMEDLEIEKKKVELQKAILEAQVNSTLDGILIVDSEGKKVLQNQRCLDLWKIPQKIGASTDDKVQLEFVKGRLKDPEQFIKKVVYLYSHSIETSFDEIEFKDGMVLERYSSPVIGKDGKNYGRIWIFHDVTIKKQAEENLKRKKMFIESVIENIPNMIFVKKAEDLTFEEMNKAGEILLGLKKKDILGKTLLEKFSKEQSDFFVAKDREVLKSGKLLDIPEESIDTPKGVRILHTKKIPIFDEKNNSLYLLGISEDITEKKQAEENISRYNNLIKSLIDNTPLLVYILDIDGHFIFMNKKLETLLGVSSGKLIGKTREDFLPKEIAILHRKNDLEVIKTKESSRFEEKNIEKDGEHIYSSQKCPLIDSKGKVYALAGISIDISEKKKYEKIIIQQKEINELKKKIK